MTQETFTIENPQKEAIEIVKECISYINGQIIEINHREISWEFEYRKQIIKCKTLISSHINKVKIKTTSNHKKKNKSYERIAIDRLHSSIRENIKLIELPKNTTQKTQPEKVSEKISYKSWVWFIGALALLFIGGKYLNNVNLSKGEEVEIENYQDSTEYNSYTYQKVDIPDSIYKKIINEKAKKSYNQNTKKIESRNTQSNSFSQFSNKKVTFKSTYYDKERNNVILNTNNEISYHTFDFKKRIVIQKSLLNGKWIEITYPINGFYEDGLTYVIIVNDLGVNEIWFSPTMLNLGYDFMDGSRIACYGLSVEN